MLDSPPGRRPYPGDDYALSFGKAKVVQEGSQLSVVSWGEMLHRCAEAAEIFENAIEIIDLRTIVPWDQESVLKSVRKTGRCLIAHEDTLTGGFGAEIGATIAAEAFRFLDAPIGLPALTCPSLTITP